MGFLDGSNFRKLGLGKNWREEFEGASPVDDACNIFEAFGIPNLV
jgi:hypothetical protein